MKRREPLSLVETLNAIAEAAQPFADLYHGATAWCVAHLRLLLVIAMVLLLFDALAYVQPLWAAALIGACVGVVITTLISLSM